MKRRIWQKIENGKRKIMQQLEKATNKVRDKPMMAATSIHNENRLGVWKQAPEEFFKFHRIDADGCAFFTSALDKRQGKKIEKILVSVLVAVACLALDFAVGVGLTSHWVRHQEGNALQMRQAGFDRDLGQVSISGFQKAGTIANPPQFGGCIKRCRCRRSSHRSSQEGKNRGAGDRKTLEKILLTGQRNEGYWKKVFSAIGDSAEEQKKK